MRTQGISEGKIQSKIYLLRGQKVMLDSDLALLYEVETKRLNEAVRRHKNRFPKDFMYQLTNKEVTNLKSQFATSSWGGTRKVPYAFTQNGIAMLSSVLTSKKAIEVNIQIMRIFTHTGELLRNQMHIYNKIQKIEKLGLKNNKDIQLIFKTIKEVTDHQDKEQPRTIGSD